MSQSAFLIFPHQLFENTDHLKSNACIFLVEDPLFFYDAKNRPFKIHKLKLFFHRASMKYYFDYLKDQGFTNVSYLDYDDLVNRNDLFKHLKTCRSEITKIKCLNPHDQVLKNVYDKLCEKNKIQFEVLEDTDMFLMGQKKLEDFYKQNKNKSRIQHVHFYQTVKEKFDVLADEPSHDSENKNALSRDFKLQTDLVNSTLNLNDYHDEAFVYITRHKQFKKHYGDIQRFNRKKDAHQKSLENKENQEGEEIINIPVTHSDAKKHLQAFLSHRFRCFGHYQDAIHSDYSVLFHSHCSFLLNAGLLTPHYVVQEVQKEARKRNSKIPMNSKEGFLRQLLGWREYMRYIYDFHYDEITRENVLKQTHSIINKKEWYKGTLGVFPVDNEIHKVIKHGHAHHIIRLMVFLNFMMLCRVQLADVYQWFMEMVSLDAYPWVMLSNISAMGVYSDKFMRKPYISTSNYISNMSNYNRLNHTNNKNWQTLWDNLFYAFLSDKKDEIRKHASIYTRNLAHYDRMSPSEKKDLHKNASNFIDKYTHKSRRSKRFF